MRRFSRFYSSHAFRQRVWLLLPGLVLVALPLIIAPNALQSGQSPLTNQRTEPSSVDLRRHEFAGPFQAQLLRVIDGDTFEARVRIWFGQEITTLVRIRGIDAPELKAKCASEANNAAQARQLLDEFLSSGEIRLFQIGLDKYAGRVLARVEIHKVPSLSEDVAELMLASAVVRSYSGGRRQSWC